MRICQNIGRAIAITLTAAAIPLSGAAQDEPAVPPEPAPSVTAPEGSLAPPKALPAVPAPAAHPAPGAAKVTVTPYGSIHLGAYFSDGSFDARDYPALASSSGRGAFLGSARASRFGMKVALPKDSFTGATLSAVMEADFKGGHTGSAPKDSAWYNALPRLRLAQLTAKWDIPTGSVSLMAGQEFGLLAPLAPSSVAWRADQVFTNSGNLNRRTPQLRATYAGKYEEKFGLTVALAALEPADGVSADTKPYAVDLGQGNAARIPDLEARAGFAYWSGKTKIVELGLSGHWNSRRVFVGEGATHQDVDEKAGAVDLEVSLPYVTIRGEGFIGRGIDDTYGGLLGASDIINTSRGLGSFTAVETRGLWGQILVTPVQWMSLAAGYGVEQVTEADLAASTSASKRTHDIMVHGGALFDLTKNWKASAELIHTISGFYGQKNAKAEQIAFGTRLDF